MIPLRDSTPSRRFPAVTVALIAVNAVAFLYELQLGSRIEEFFLEYGIVPYFYSSPRVASQLSLVELGLPFFTSMFLHGGWMHIIGNMWFLWIFGDNVEDRLGRGRYVAFYLVCGLAAGAMHVASTVFAVRAGMMDAIALTIPTIGASGALSGVMGAYLIMFPRARVLTLIPIFFFIHFANLPAYVFLGIWFIMQFFNGTVGLLGGADSFGGIAWWAHIGGFAAGALLVKVFQIGAPKSGRRISRFEI
jgi:membrane associated rhomboid family serine protease